MADGKIEIETGINTSGIDKGAKTISQKLKTLGGGNALKSIAGLGSAITGVKAAFDLASAAIKKVTDNLAELSAADKTQEIAEKRLETAAKNNPYLDDYSVKKLKEYAGELQNIGDIGDESLLPMMSELVAAGRSYNEIQEIMSAALDASASGMISMESAVESLNMSYGGSVGQLGKLLPSLKNLTDEELKSGKAIEEVKKAYGGMAAATADTGTQLANSFGDLKEKIGGLLNKVVVPLQKALLITANAANALWDKLSNIINGGDDAQATTLESKLIKVQAELDALREQAEKQKSQYKEIADAQAGYTDQITEAEKKLEEAKQKGNKTAIAMYETQLKLLKDQAAITKQSPDMIAAIDAEKEKRDEATEAINRQIEAKEKEIAAIQKEINDNKTAEQLKKEQEARDKVRAAYDATIAAKEKEIALRRSAGEEISAEAEAQEMYNTAFAAYIKMMSDPAFKGNSGNYEHEKNARAEIANWAEIGGKDDLKKQIADFETDLKAAADKANGIAKSQYDALLDMLDAEYKAVIDSKYLEEEEKLRIEKEFAEKRKQIVAAKNKEEADGTQAKINALLSGHETYWDKYTAKEKEIADLKTEIQANADAKRAEAREQYKGDEEALAAALVEIDAQANEQMKELDEAHAQNRKDLFANIMGDVANYTNQTVSIVQDALKLQQQTLENNTKAELATLEEKYRKGEISEEEYENEKTNIKKDAAKQQYKIDMANWAAQILQATANIALGVTQAIAKGGVAGIIMGALVGAAGAVQMASIIASKPTPPSFATGGVVGGMNGASMGGDNTYVHARRGEMIMNAAQQRGLWEMLNGGTFGGGKGVNLVINNSASNLVTAQPQLTKDKIELLIDARVNDGLKKGRYNNSLNTAQQGMSGDYYGI